MPVTTKFQWINFDFNNRINEFVSTPGCEDRDLRPFLADLIQELDPIENMRLEDLPLGRAEAPWVAVRGPGLYALIDTVDGFPPKIVWIGKADDCVKIRVAQHRQNMQRESMGTGKPRPGPIVFFDSVRSVFIEHDEIRQILERELIKYFQDPDNGHADSLLNKHIG
jgi:hypothetical protein